MKLKAIHVLLIVLLVLIVQGDSMRSGWAQENQQQSWDYEFVYVELKSATILVYSDDVGYMETVLGPPWKCKETEGFCGAVSGMMGREDVLDAWGSDGWEMSGLQTVGENMTLFIFGRPLAY